MSFMLPPTEPQKGHGKTFFNVFRSGQCTSAPKKSLALEHTCLRGGSKNFILKLISNIKNISASFAKMCATFL